MTKIHSFPPISDPKAVTLILGSMPGKASLLEGKYYAHPRNAFWRIIQSIFELDPSLSYAERCSQLLNHRIALWDVLKTCTRSSSLDSDIVDSSIIANDFESFFFASLADSHSVFQRCDGREIIYYACTAKPAQRYDRSRYREAAINQPSIRVSEL